MTSKRKLILVAISVVIAGLLGVYFTDGILWNSGKRITKENFDKIEIGMTFEQVEDVFGFLPSDDRLEAPPNDGEDAPPSDGEAPPSDGEAAWIGVWNGSGVQASLDFSVEDVLVDKQWHKGHF